jgi:ABC-type Fe3+/spermidine/putrescine transport system ATPase subunit
MLLEISDIEKTYENAPLLRGVSFSVDSGETICLLGRSGSGKSTLLRIIAGLETAERGNVFWEGVDISNTPVHRRGFGLMFQDYALFPHRTVGQNVAFGLRMQNLGEDEIESRTLEMLHLVHMESFANRKVTDLSGGEQQRIALARALAPRPKLLMLDEPLGALDKALKQTLLEELRDIIRSTHIPAIYVTHDQEEAFSIADRLVLLNSGRIEQIGSPEEVFRYPGSTWVATFLGLGNLIPAEVTSGISRKVRSVL